MSSHQTSSDIMPVATALKRLLRFSGFRCCRSTEETLCSVAGLKCMERLKSKIGWGIQAGCRRIWRGFSQKRKNNDRERHWRSCFWSLCSSGCSSPSGKSAITFLTYRMWNERASCPSVHFLLLIRDPPPHPPRGQDWQDMLSLQCVLGLPDRCAWNLSGGSWVRGGSPGGISIRFPTPPQGAVVVLHGHSVSVPREKLYFCCFVSAALSFGPLVSTGGGGYVGMDIYLFHLNKWSNALILPIAYFCFLLSLVTKLGVSTFFLYLFYSPSFCPLWSSNSSVSTPAKINSGPGWKNKKKEQPNSTFKLLSGQYELCEAL